MNKDSLRKLSSIGTQNKAEQRVPADIANFITLDDLMVRQAIAAERLEKLANLGEIQVPTGLKPLSMTITTTVTKVVLNPPWIAFVITNDDSTYGIYYSINKEEDLYNTLIEAGETSDVDMKYPIIHSLYLVAESGGTPAIRLWGIQGKR